MAEYDLKLVVDADTTEAQRKLDALGGGASAEGGKPPTGTPAPSASPEAEAAAARVRRVRAGSDGRPTLSNNPDDFGRKAGEIAGRAIGKAVAGFLAHEVAGTVFANLKAPGADNRTVEKAESAVGGALRYGTMGAMLGGPWGAAIGGVVGAGVGYYQEQTRQKKAAEAEENATRISDYARRRDTAIGASDSAFSRSLDLAGGWRRRLEAMRARREEIATGSGPTSIRSLEGFLRGADPNARNTIELKGILEAQKNRVASLDRQILEEGLSVAPGRMEAGSVTDSWAKRGVQVGAQVDVAQVNEKIMGEVQSCRALLEKIANMGTDNIIDINGMQRAVYE